MDALSSTVYYVGMPDHNARDVSRGEQTSHGVADHPPRFPTPSCRLTLARLLGHRNLNQVRRYAHLSPDHLHAAVDRTAASVFAGEVPRAVPHDTVAVA